MINVKNIATIAFTWAKAHPVLLGTAAVVAAGSVYAYKKFKKTFKSVTGQLEVNDNGVRITMMQDGKQFVGEGASLQDASHHLLDQMLENFIVEQPVGQF